MTKIYAKLIVISLALILSVVVVVMSSYAWFVLSGNPAANGIQVAVGGGNTILVAADLTQTVDGITYHYPDTFSDKLNFSQHDSYDYLQTLEGLTPVSTADGVNWFLPAYYSSNDDAVRQGEALNGELKDVSEFILDNTLSHANLRGADDDTVRAGSYYYLDFWVVSPGQEYTLHLSTGADSGGSFLVDLLQPAEVGTDVTFSGYTLREPENKAAAAARVGFLVNPTRITDNTMLYYQTSRGFDQRYTQLRGSYQETNDGTVSTEGWQFTIYEPNADYHPGSAEDGSYIPTWPVAVGNGDPAAASVMDRVTVQKKSSWIVNTDSQPAIEQIFQTAMLGRDLSEMTAAQIAEAFYGGYLQGQVSPYVAKREGSGDFFARSMDLAKFNGSISAEELAKLDTAGATDDVCLIELERNVPQRIRMFIWLEGQDVDCVNTASASSFALSIELAGSNEQ